MPLAAPRVAQVASLQARAEGLQSDLEAAAAQQSAAVEAALAAAEERVALELRGQQLSYEGRIQASSAASQPVSAALPPGFPSVQHRLAAGCMSAMQHRSILSSADPGRFE